MDWETIILILIWIGYFLFWGLLGVLIYYFLKLVIREAIKEAKKDKWFDKK